MGILIKSSLRGAITGITIPVAMMFNNYLFYDLKINYIFPTPDWYIYVHLALFFPVTGILSMDTSLPLTNHNLLIIIVSIAANGFIYAIIFGAEVD